MQKFRLVAIALLCAAYSATFASAPPPPPPAPAPAPAPASATDDRDRDRDHDRDDKSSHDIKKFVKKVIESLKETSKRER